MEAIYKYPLLLIPFQTIDVPGTYRVLSIKLQNGEPVLWAAVRDNEDGVTVGLDISMFGTGKHANGVLKLNHIDTIQLDNGLVFHFFKKSMEW